MGLCQAFLRKSKHHIIQEQKNPTQQLNSDARLLVKFLTSINKSFNSFT